MTTESGKPRRSSGNVRQDHLDRNAFLIQFDNPGQPIDMFRRDVSPAIKPATLLSGSELQSAGDQYRTMERKGFRVTKDTGCLIPHEQYCTYQQGATVKGHQRTFGFFAHWQPKGGSLRNQFGWPVTPQISHLCHRRSCCRVDHLLAEEQWRNLKRNFCGYGGTCDCGNEIKCIKRYSMLDQEDEPAFCATEEEVKAALQGAPSFRILHRNHYSDRDSKAEKRKANKQKRKRKQDLHAYETAKKQRKLSKKEVVVEEEDDSEGE
jgi:Zinc-binding loop region of homing endonuclease